MGAVSDAAGFLGCNAEALHVHGDESLLTPPSLSLNEVFRRELAFQGPPDGSEIPGPLLPGRYSPPPTVIKGLLSPPRVVERRLILPNLYHSSSFPPTVSLWIPPNQILPDPLYLQQPSLNIVASGEGHSKPTLKKAFSRS